MSERPSPPIERCSTPDPKEKPKPLKPSGAQNRKAAKERTAKDKSSRSLSPDVLARIGEPPEDETAALPWGIRAVMVITNEILKAPRMSLVDRARHLREMIRTLGMVYPRAELEKILKDHQERNKAKKNQNSGVQKLESGAWQGGVPDESATPESPPVSSS